MEHSGNTTGKILTRVVPREWPALSCRRPAPSFLDPGKARGTEPLGKAPGVQCHSSAPEPQYYCGTEHWCTCVTDGAV